MADKNPHAIELGRLGGKANTEAQNKARAQNGRKGGRPKKDENKSCKPERSSLISPQ